MMALNPHPLLYEEYFDLRSLRLRDIPDSSIFQRYVTDHLPVPWDDATDQQRLEYLASAMESFSIGGIRNTLCEDFRDNLLTLKYQVEYYLTTGQIYRAEEDMLGGSVTPSSLETLRVLNKREERRLKVALDRKHGIRDAHAYRLAEMAKERRLVERELERIGMSDVSKGQRGPPVKVTTSHRPRHLDPLLHLPREGKPSGRGARAGIARDPSGEDRLHRELSSHLETWHGKMIDIKDSHHQQPPSEGMPKSRRPREEERQPLNLRQLRERMETLLGSTLPGTPPPPNSLSSQRGKRERPSSFHDCLSHEPASEAAGSQRRGGQGQTRQETSNDALSPENGVSTKRSRRISPGRLKNHANADTSGQAVKTAAGRALAPATTRDADIARDAIGETCPSVPGVLPALRHEGAALAAPPGASEGGGDAATPTGARAGEHFSPGTEAKREERGQNQPAALSKDTRGEQSAAPAQHAWESSFAVVHSVAPTPASSRLSRVAASDAAAASAARGLPAERSGLPIRPALRQPATTAAPRQSSLGLTESGGAADSIPHRASREEGQTRRKRYKDHGLGVRFREDRLPSRSRHTEPGSHAVQDRQAGGEAAGEGKEDKQVSRRKQLGHFSSSTGELRTSAVSTRPSQRKRFSTLLSLSATDMKSVRSDVSRRLNSNTSPPANTSTTAATNGAATSSTPTSYGRGTGGQSKRVSSFTNTVPAPGAGGSKKTSSIASPASQAKKEGDAGKVPTKDVQDSTTGAAASGQEKEATEQPGQETAAPEEGDVTDASGDKPRRRKSRVKEVPVVPVVEFDADRYNADGSLRTMHRLPDSDKAWEQAQKARYIRLPPRLSRDTDKELSVKEIFSK